MSSTRNQMVLSVGLVVVAAVVVFFVTRSGDAAPAQQMAEGHDHSAMTAGGGERQPVVLSREASDLIGVTFATVERGELPAKVQAVGTVAYDETRLASVTPKIDGWVEHLEVDFTGAPVRAGQPLMDVYSPALVTAQEELILAARLVRDAPPGRALGNAEELLTSARRRLAYWDIPEEEIRRIEESGEPSKTLTLRSPATGIVVEKNVVEGDRIGPGTTVYRIADLSRVWVEAEVFEKDLARVAEGQDAMVTFEAYPGRDFPGRVTYVHPTVSVQSRTARVRLELANPDGALKPGMYADIELQALPSPPTLLLPRSAVIQTGERALVFVLAPDGALVPHEVETGRTAGRAIEILAGVEVSERVVSSAAFLVDAESNLGTMTAADRGDDMEEMDHSGHTMPADTIR
jgi:Cu(I)/Ag(I) efflux system membrane fusion protein